LFGLGGVAGIALGSLRTNPVVNLALEKAARLLPEWDWFGEIAPGNSFVDGRVFQPGLSFDLRQAKDSH
jgi:hypothetical protein